MPGVLRILRADVSVDRVCSTGEIDLSDGANQVYDESLFLTPNLQFEVITSIADF